MDVETAEIPHEKLDETGWRLEAHDEIALVRQNFKRLAPKHALVGGEPSSNKVCRLFVHSRRVATLNI